MSETYALDVKSVLHFENNLTDVIGTYSWTNSGSVPFSSTYFYDGAYSVGPFSTTQNINATLADDIETIDMWLYVPTDAIGTIFECGDVRLYLDATSKKMMLAHTGVGTIGNFDIPHDSWIRLQVNFDGSYEVIFINGIEQAEQQTSYMPTGLIHFGNSLANDDPFGGYLDKQILSTKSYDGVEILELPPLTLIDVQPNNGPAAGGTFVTLTGLKLDEVTSVTFGGIEANSVVIVDDKTITCFTPGQSIGTAEHISVDVVVTNGAETATITAGFTYTQIVAVLPDSGSATFVVEKDNYVLASTVTPSTPDPNVAYISDGSHIHFSLDDFSDRYYKLAAGQNVVIDFGSAQPVKKITLFMYPQTQTYFTTETAYNNSLAKIEYWDGSAWQTVLWKSFNEYYGLQTAQLYNNGLYYGSNAGIISLWDETGVTTQKLRITAPGMNVAITEIEACDLIIANPSNIRINEISDSMGGYQGIVVGGTFTDTDFSIYLGTNYRHNAFLKATFKDQTRVFGQLSVDNTNVDEKTYQTYIEAVNIYTRLEDSLVNINALIGTNDYAKVIEWLLACADYFRDLYLISVNIANFDYIPENGNVQDELNNVLKSAGDVQMFTQDGLFAIKTRTQETPDSITINAITDSWSPKFNIFANDFYGLPAFAEQYAPLMGFSLAETFTNSFARWREGFMSVADNVSFVHLPAKETGVGSTGQENHYAMRLTITDSGPGKISMKGRTLFGTLNPITRLDIFQYVLSQGQGTITLQNQMYDYGYPESVAIVTLTINVDTSSCATRVIFYKWHNTGTPFREYVGLIFYDETHHSIIYQNDKYYTFGAVTGHLDYVTVENIGSVGTTVDIEGIGCTGAYKRSVVFEGAVPGALEFFTLQYATSIDNAFYVFTQTPGDDVPVEAVNNNIKNNPGDTIKVFLIPKSGSLFITNCKWNINGTNFYNGFASSWNAIILQSEITVNYLSGVDTDIENGTIQIYPRDLKYRKGARNVNEDVMKTRVKIGVNNYVVAADVSEIYKDSLTHVITNAAFSTECSYQASETTAQVTIDYTKTIGGNNYSNTYSSGTYYNATMDSDITYKVYPLGAKLTIAPRSIVNIFVTAITINGNIYDNTGTTNDIIDFAASQKIYGIIEEDISNPKVNSAVQAALIQKKYERFAALPILFLSDGVTCDLNLNLDLAKYAIISDEMLYKNTGTYKVNEYEIFMDVTNDDYSLTVKGRAQNYTDY